MAFEYPSTITARKAKEKAKEKEKAKAKEKAKEQEYDDAFSSAKNVIKKLNKKDEDDIKIGIMGNQLDSAFSSENIGKKELSPKSAKKVVDAAADENQLSNTERKYARDLFKKGGLVRSGKPKIAKKGWR